MRGLLVLFLLGITLVLGWNAGFSLLFRVSFLLAVGLVLGPLWVWTHLRQVEGKIEASPRQVQVGQQVDVRIELRNRSFLPKPWLELRLNSNLPTVPKAMVAYLPGGSVRSWSFYLPCPRRGEYFLGPLVLGSRDPLGLFQRELTLGPAYDLQVYPITVDLPSSVLGAAQTASGESPLLAPLGVTPPVRGIRDYLLGDSFNRIHWLTSVRMRKLMSKELERESSQDIWILLDMEGGIHAGEGQESTEEYGVTLAASLAKAFLEANRSVALATWDESFHLVLPSKGTAQLWRILETLSVVAARGREPLFRLMAQVEEHC